MFLDGLLLLLEMEIFRLVLIEFSFSALACWDCFTGLFLSSLRGTVERLADLFIETRHFSLTTLTCSFKISESWGNNLRFLEEPDILVLFGVEFEVVDKRLLCLDGSPARWVESIFLSCEAFFLDDLFLARFSSSI